MALAAVNYIVIRGVVSMWKYPPTATFMLIILFIGILLGVFMSIIHPSYEDYEKNMGKDKGDN